MRYIIIFTLLVLLNSCDNTFDVISEPRDIPVVYGILAASDTAHYIRVERAFVDENVSAFDLAQDPSLLYYGEEVSVSISGPNGSVVFDRIDATQDGFPRQAGVFAQTPNILYKASKADLNLIEGEEYQLQIDRQIDTLPLITGSTTIVGESSIRTPSALLNFDNASFTAFSWREGEASSIFDLYLDFRYRERITGSGEPFQPRVARWQIAQDIEGTRLDIQGIQFYSFLAGAIPQDDNVERVFETIDLVLDSGSEEIRDFIRISEANLGITSSQDVPTFTNLSEGRGLFASLYREVKENVALTNKTLDSLRTGSITGDLNFN